MQNPPYGSTGKSSTGLDENVAALLSYIFGWISGLILFLVEKDSKLVRFHAMQSILFCVLVGVVAIVLWIFMVLGVIVAAMLSDVMASIFGLLITVFWLAFCLGILITWILCVVRAYQGQYFKLPFIGGMAEKIVNK